MSAVHTSIACIIPTYNRGAVICDTIQHLLNQSLRPDEIIVVDQTREYDPRTLDRMRIWAGNGDITWVSQTEPNASRARNTGALLAQSEILLFLDDDILPSANLIEAHVINYSDPAVTGVAGQILDGQREIVYTLAGVSHRAGLVGMTFPKNYAYRCSTPWMASGNVSIRRSLFIELGGMDERYRRGALREETDFQARYVRAGHSFIFDPTASLYHFGYKIVKKGGCRDAATALGGWHHYIGAWYYTVRWACMASFLPLLYMHFRGLVLNRSHLQRSWEIPLRFAMFAAALPVAILLRIMPPLLLDSEDSGARNVPYMARIE